MAGLARVLEPAGRALLDRLAADPPGEELRVATGLRAEGFDPDLVGAALAQDRLRRRAVSRFGSIGARLWWTAAGLEQASRPEVSAHRASRFAGTTKLADLCCGVGLDLTALARVVPTALGVDLDPEAALAARANAEELGLTDRVEVRCADVRSVDPVAEACDAVFVDPARRTAAGRTYRPEDYQPPYSFVAELAARVPATAAKLAPGMPHRLLPEAVEAEWVSVGGEVKELCLWHGPLSTPGVARRATLLPSGATITDEELGRPPVGPVGRWLIEPDGAVIRAGLVAQVAARADGRLLDQSIAYVVTDADPTTSAAAAYGRSFEVLEELPFARKRLRAALRDRGYGDVVVKKRGINVVPEELRKDLRLTGGGPTATLVLTRTARGPLALLATPAPSPRTPHPSRDHAESVDHLPFDPAPREPPPP